MLARWMVTAAVCGLPFVGGCAIGDGYDGTGRNTPEFKLHNGTRLAKEVGWFYADVQDTLFGVDYYLDLENEFGGGPYR